MAVIPSKFSPSGGSDKERIAALERYIKYLEEQIEHFSSMTNKKIEEVKNYVRSEKKD